MTVVEGSVRAPVLDRVKGQPDALQVLRGSLASPVHAYFFVGPPGTGRRDASIAFAAALMCPNGGCGECASCTEALAGRHPDLVVTERVGASISVLQARDVVRTALRTPRAAPYQVLVLVDFDIVDEAAPVLLKTIEEPPDSTVIIITGETVPRPFVTIASRCVRVPFKPLDTQSIIDVLAAESVDAATAAAVAEAAGGRLDRARLLARDPGFVERLHRWRTVPSRLDGTGSRIAELADELLTSANEPLEEVRARQAEELDTLKQDAERRGEKAIPGRDAIDARHKRELRRVRTDELRAGLDVLLSLYRDRLVAPKVSSQRLRTTLTAMAAIDEAGTRLSRNVNETMLLQWLLLRLDT